jgi:cytochrome c5
MGAVLRLAPVALLGTLFLLVAGPSSAQSDKGEELLNASCTSCHDLRPIDTQALDEAGWTREVESMIEKGAQVSKADVPLLVEHLVRMHGPLPDGPGKEILLHTCTPCHDLQRVRREKRSAEGWLEILDAMLNEGAQLSGEDLPVLLRYLARNFRPER